MKHATVPRFTHEFRDLRRRRRCPSAYRGRLFGVAPLQSHVVMSDVFADGSSFKTDDVGYAIESRDDWFRPVNVTPGPDGAIYVCDMYEQQIDHLRHHEGKIDRESGRIYRLKAKNVAPIKPFDPGRAFQFGTGRTAGPSKQWRRPRPCGCSAIARTLRWPRIAGQDRSREPARLALEAAVGPEP